jgi:hypothetical protein
VANLGEPNRKCVLNRLQLVDAMMPLASCPRTAQVRRQKDCSHDTNPRNCVKVAVRIGRLRATFSVDAGHVHYALPDAVLFALTARASSVTDDVQRTVNAARKRDVEKRGVATMKITETVKDLASFVHKDRQPRPSEADRGSPIADS